MTSAIRKAPTWAVPCADSYAFAAVNGAVLGVPAVLAARVVRVRELALDGTQQRKQGWSVFTGTNPIAQMAAHPANMSGPDPGGPPV
jgi:hypothetical protein